MKRAFLCPSIVFAALCPLQLPAAEAPRGQSAMIAPATADAEDCNRRCLLTFLTQYTEALLDNKPDRVPAAASLRVTGNGVVKKLGEHEVWGTPRRMPFRQALVDPATGAAVFFGVVTNDVKQRGATPAPNAEPAAKWWFYALRLQIAKHEITEVEEVSFDGALPTGSAKSLALPDRIFDTVLPVSERSTRAELVKAALAYFDVVSHQVDTSMVPWHPECQRLELGTFTTNGEIFPGSCAGAFRRPGFKWNVVNRRIYIADVERGLVFGIANFTTPPEFPNNNGSVVFEVFKIQDGLIRHIHAFFRGNGQLHSGWGEGPGS